MSARSLVTVGAGILAAGVVIATGGTGTFALGAFSIAATLAGALIGPEKQDGPKPDEMEAAQSTEDVSVPVIFGTARISQQHIFVGEDDFESIPVKQETGGKGGGVGGNVASYNYTVPIHYGLCMGPVDRLWSVVNSPAHDYYFFSENGVEMDGNPEVISVHFTDEQNGQTFEEGGTATFYPGEADQGSENATTDTNHRHFCWLKFDSYFMTGNPNPTSLLFKITRMPRVLDDEGQAIPAFLTRASTDESHEEYWDANPAAVAWEIQRNSIWGKGTPASELDEESFVAASQFYASIRVGISTAISRTTPSEFMTRLKEIFGLVVWWDGEKIRAKCMWDRSNAYSPRIRITEEDLIGSPDFARPSLSSTSNELRTTFINREADYEKELATDRDVAHAEMLGQLKSTSFDASEVGTRRAAELITAVKLREIAYPRASLTIRVRRPYSGLQPSSFVEFVTDEWHENRPITTFWQVASIEDDDQSQEGLKIVLMEDLYATAVDGEITDFTAPIPSIEEDLPLTWSELNDGNEDRKEIGSLLPVMSWEPNSFMTGGARSLLVAITREFTHVESATVGWTRTGSGDARTIGATTAFPIMGLLKTALPGTLPRLLRDQTVEIELNNASEAEGFEAATGLVMSDDDDFSALTASLQAILLIGNEVIRVGFAEETATGQVTIRTMIRGELGSEIEEHALDSEIAFFPVFQLFQLLSITGLPRNEAIDLQLLGNSAFSVEEQSAVTYPPSGGRVYNGRSVRPLAPEFISATRSANTWTLRLRPRLWTGAGSNPELADDLANFITDLSGYSLRIRDGLVTATVPAGVSFSEPPYDMPAGLSIDDLQWYPDDGTTGSGLLVVEVTFATNPATIEVEMVFNSLGSEVPTIINQP